MILDPRHLALVALGLGLALGWLALRAWSRRAMPTAGPLALALAGLSIWILADALVLATQGLHDKMLAQRIVYVGIGLFPTSLLVLAFRAGGRADWPGARGLALLTLEPLASVALAATNEMHGWMWSQVALVVDGGHDWLALERGPAFWAHAAYSHTLAVGASVVLLRKALRNGGPAREWLRATAGLGAPWVANLCFLAGFHPIAHVDLTPYAFGLTAVAFGRLVLRGHFLDPGPLARARVVEALRDGLLVVDAAGQVVDANPALCEILGIEELPPDRRVERVLASHPRLLALARTDPPARGDLSLAGTGGERIFDARSSPLALHHGRTAGLLLSLRDVTETRGVEAELRASEERYRGLVEHASEAILQLDAEGRVVSANRVALELLRPGSERARDLPLEAWVAGDDLAGVRARMRALAPERAVQLELRLRRGDGALTWCRGSLKRLEDGGFQLIAYDDSERRAAEARIRRLAYYDALTSLPNRQLFEWQLERALSGACMRSMHLAVLFVDLDGFKDVNDTLGHSAGDELLCQVSQRFRETLRHHDLVGRTGSRTREGDAEVSRLGGDEFTVLVPDLSDPADALTVAKRLLDAVAASIQVRGEDVVVSASIGIAVYPTDGEDAETLLRNADRAMYEAKKTGAGQVRFYDASMNVQGTRRLQLEGRLRGALERGELSLRYQPLRDARSGHLTAVETLLRWQAPDLGEVSPEEFIPVAERSGLIIAIGAWVLRRACEELGALEARGLLVPRVAVNVSGRQLEQPDFADAVAEVLADAGMGAGRLELEITEQALFRNIETVHTNLFRLEELGVGLALDDFGVGHSSLSRLRDLPIGRVKIDRDFVRGVPEAESGRFAAAVIAMAHHLGIPVVAEGVEEEAQVTFLRAKGCDELQGFLWGRPMRAERLAELLEREKPDDPPHSAGGIGA